MIRKINIVKTFTTKFLSLIFISGTFVLAGSAYEKDITLPTCDASNPMVQFINSNDDWSNINRLDKSIFCVSPGDYIGAGRISITADGVADKKRYIMLYNGNNTHPAQLPFSQRANVLFEMNGANYWVIDRMSLEGYNAGWYAWNMTSSQHNIFNRLYMSDNRIMMRHTNGSYTTIQNSAFYDMSEEGLFNDAPAIIFQSTNKYVTFVNNEIRNCSDSIQFTRGDIGGKADQAGTIIDDNRMWIDSTIYTDRDGTPNPNGLYAKAENSIGLKNGSFDPNNPMIITNNQIWGFRASAEDGSKRGHDGTAMGGMLGSENILIKDNLIFDGAGGYNVAAPATGELYGQQHIELVGNTFWDTGRHMADMYYGVAFKATHPANDINIHNNDFIGGRLYTINPDSVSHNNFKVHNNKFIDAPEAHLPERYNISCYDNSYHNSPSEATCTGSLTINDITVEITFQYEIHTATPKTKTVMVVKDSPVYKYLTNKPEPKSSEPISQTIGNALVIIPPNNDNETGVLMPSKQ